MIKIYAGDLIRWRNFSSSTEVNGDTHSSFLMAILGLYTLYICKFPLSCNDTEHQLRISPWLFLSCTEQDVYDLHSFQGVTEDIQTSGSSGLAKDTFISSHACCSTFKDYGHSLQWGLCLARSFVEKVFKENSQSCIFCITFPGWQGWN